MEELMNRLMVAGLKRVHHPYEDVNLCCNDFKSRPIIIIGLWEAVGEVRSWMWLGPAVENEASQLLEFDSLKGDENPARFILNIRPAAAASRHSAL